MFFPSPMISVSDVDPGINTRVDVLMFLIDFGKNKISSIPRLYYYMSGNRHTQEKIYSRMYNVRNNDNKIKGFLFKNIDGMANPIPQYESGRYTARCRRLHPSNLLIL